MYRHAPRHTKWPNDWQTFTDLGCQESTLESFRSLLVIALFCAPWRLGASQNVICSCIGTPWGSKVTNIIYKTRQTSGWLRVPKTFAETVEKLPPVGAILKTLVQVLKLSGLVLMPPNLANGMWNWQMNWVCMGMWQHINRTWDSFCLLRLRMAVWRSDKMTAFLDGTAQFFRWRR